MGPRCQDQFRFRVDGSTGKGRQLGCHIFADLIPAPVFRIGHTAALLVPFDEGIQTAGDRLMGVHIPVGEIHCRPRQRFPPQIQFRMGLPAFLPRCVVDAQPFEFFCQDIHSTSSLLYFGQDFSSFLL